MRSKIQYSSRGKKISDKNAEINKFYSLLFHICSLLFVGNRHDIAHDSLLSPAAEKCFKPFVRSFQIYFIIDEL